MEDSMRRALLVIAVVMVTGSVLAAEFNLPPGKWWENERLIRHINLTDEQRQQINGLVYEHAHRMIDLNADLKRAELELATLVGQPEFDAGQVRTAFGAFQQARQSLDLERFEMLLSVREVMTAEQWQKIQEIRNEYRRRQGGGLTGGRIERGRRRTVTEHHRRSQRHRSIEQGTGDRGPEPETIDTTSRKC
jgi:Spy/CpxP family protein refolding chaperone